jgi:tRNA threonylcarbamoyl adenosine modification protein YeaZ
VILAVDTSAGTAVALVSPQGAVLAERSEASTMRHAEVVGDLIRDTLAAAGLAAGDVTAVASGMGPGPFTGLRIGIAAARAFAFGRGVPVVPIASHDAIAAAWFAEHASAGMETVDLLVVTDARRREVA